ncbi:hypothetical protein VSH64_03145 [Amycolatopsis rhabdoformis]|uniref:DUF4229 domain-containing protein n=1 Tax=Amycolatopsis rhabdoformis TaxID=1448059 RepID=A0ABZ1IBV5_9PSEU|nr:hypothetical protein [Amycolatopsis rhabdoformis]WSE31118.1 hypothetical protein VSH64_03145 [Amycolatopsis rhabdoformis]
MDPFLPAPQPIRWRRGVYAAAIVIPFTVIQVWALLVLLSVADFTGLVAQAVVVLVLGSVVSLAVGWRWAWRLGTERRRALEIRREVEAWRAAARETVGAERVPAGRRW